MVREANMKQAASEKQLREAHGKVILHYIQLITSLYIHPCDYSFCLFQIDMLQAEVSALKTLVITSTPSSPNRELHPQLQSPSKNALRKGHARNKSAGCAAVVPAALPAQPINTEGKEVKSNIVFFLHDSEIS